MFKKLKNILQKKIGYPQNSHLSFVKEPLVNEIELYYDKWTDKYLESYGDIFQAIRPSSDEKLLKYLQESIGIKNGMKLLDAGCGVCGPSVYFAQQNEVTIDAVTISNKQVSIATEKIEKAGLRDRVRVKKGDFHKLDKLYESNNFDTVFFLESLGYADSLETLLNGVYKVLKVGGCVYIKDYFFVPATSAEHFTAQTQTAIEVRREYCYRLLDIEKLISILRKKGFYLVYIKRRDFSDDYTKAGNFEKENGHGSVCLRAMINPFPLYEPLELKFQKVS